MAFHSAKDLFWVTTAENFVLTFGNPMRLNWFAMWTQVMQKLFRFQNYTENNPNGLPRPLCLGPHPHFLLLSFLTAHFTQSLLAHFPFLECSRLVSSGPLHLLFLLPKKLFGFIFTWLSFLSTRSLLHQLRKAFLHHISSKLAPHPLPRPITLFY